MASNVRDLDINEIFDDVIKQTKLEPNGYPLNFELDNLKELFEFLLEFVTMLCKYFYGDTNGKVNLASLSPSDLEVINRYIQFIGFNCNFQSLPANSYNLNYAHTNRYDRIAITSSTNLKDLFLGIKCDQILFIINFDNLPKS